MGRSRRWVLEDNLSEAVWRTILRGPRPPATAWARASSRVGATRFASQQSPNPLPKKGKGKGQPRVANPVKSHATPKSESTRTSSLNPDEQLQAAQARVVKLEAALMAIGEEDPAAAGLLEALSKARLQAQVRPVQDRITHTEAFLSRSKKKLETLNAEASRIQEELAQVSARIRDGERRLEALKAEAIAQPSPFTMQPDPQEEIRLLRARIAQMEKQGSMEDGTQEGSQKRPKTCATSSVALVPFTRARNRSQSGSMMSDLIDQADAALRNR